MKKKNIYRVLATAFAVTLVVTSPMASMTTYALGFNIDAQDDTDYGEMPANYWDSFKSESSSSESEPSYSEPSYTEPVQSEPTYSEASSGTSYSESSSTSSESNTASSGSTSSTVATVKTANDITVNVTGGQKFRIVMSADHKSYQVFHCGISKATFVVADADGNTATYSSVALEQCEEDGLWYMNISFPQGVDTTGYAVGVTKGDATYLTSLGVSGIKVNGVLALSTVSSTDAN